MWRLTVIYYINCQHMLKKLQALKYSVIALLGFFPCSWLILLKSKYRQNTIVFILHLHMKVIQSSISNTNTLVNTQ